MTEPIDPELEALLASERCAPAPAEGLDRVWSRLAAAPLASALRPHASWATSHAVSLAAAAFVAGVAAGAGAYGATRTPAPPRLVVVELPVPLPVIAPRELPPPSPPVALPPLPSPAPSAPVAMPAPSVDDRSPSQSLRLERSMLDHARSDLTARDPESVLRMTEYHARHFTHPQLAEEREALAIQALVGLTRYEEARARAARFRATSPNSLFLPSIDATIASIP